jgi:hypothetical protein
MVTKHKFYVTKYALSTGIMEVEGEVDGKFPNMMRPVDKSNFAVYHGDEWHLDFKSAQSKAMDMRERKLKLLRKQIQRLEAKTFDINENTKR